MVTQAITLLSPDATALMEVQDAIGELRERWRPWQARYDIWMEWLHRGAGAGPEVASLGSLFNKGPVVELKERRSVYFSEWVSTRRNALHSRIMSAKTNIQPAIYGDSEKDRFLGEGLVQLSLGLTKALDVQKVKGFGGYSWDGNMKQQITDYGKTVFMVQVTASEGEARLTAPLLDVKNVYHTLDSHPGDQQRVVYEREVRWSDVPGLVRQLKGDMLPARPDDKKPSDSVTISHFWQEWQGEVLRSLLVDGQPIRASVWWDPGYRSLPIVIVSNPGGSHRSQNVGSGRSGSTDAQVYYHAEPFYARAISQLIFLEGLESLAADAAALAGLPVLLHRKAAGGESGADPSEVKPMGWIELLEDEQLNTLQGIAAGAFTVDNAIQRVYQNLQSVYPDFLVTPDFPAGTSGFAMNSQIGQARIYLTAPTRMAEMAKMMLMGQAIEQHQALAPNASFHLRGILPEGGRFARKFSVEDYPSGHFDIEVQEPAEIPGEAALSMNIAVQGVQSGLISPWTARVTRLGISDPQAEADRVLAAAVEQGQSNINQEQLKQMRERVDALKAEAKRARSRETRETLKRQIMVAENDLAAFERQLGIAPEVGFEQAPEFGVPPSSNPPQNTTENPQLQAMAEGRQSVGVQGRPREPGAR